MLERDLAVRDRQGRDREDDGGRRARRGGHRARAAGAGLRPGRRPARRPRRLRAPVGGARRAARGAHRVDAQAAGRRGCRRRPRPLRSRSPSSLTPRRGQGAGHDRQGRRSREGLGRATTSSSPTARRPVTHWPCCARRGRSPLWRTSDRSARRHGRRAVPPRSRRGPATSALRFPRSCRSTSCSSSTRACARRVGRGLDLIVVNGVYPDRFSDEEAERLHAIDGEGPVRERRSRSTARRGHTPSAWRGCAIDANADRHAPVRVREIGRASCGLAASIVSRDTGQRRSAASRSSALCIAATMSS